ncbi:hypothetical protein [Nonomuraea sp. B19D2]|uniref:hypothetical protein n=1 Tax=Nonomuraea sp. B19D2 TaxID=3159561 RepID=UPI0032DACB65
MSELSRRGWEVTPAGKGTFPAALCQALSRTNSALRYFPDMLATRAGDVVAIDAKTRVPASHMTFVSDRHDRRPRRAGRLTSVFDCAASPL